MDFKAVLWILKLPLDFKAPSGIMSFNTDKEKRIEGSKEENPSSREMKTKPCDFWTRHGALPTRIITLDLPAFSCFRLDSCLSNLKH